MDSGGVIALLSGGAPVERTEWSSECCEELCALLRRRAPVAGGANAMDFVGRNATGDTAFLLACNVGRVECMQLLADAGCNTAAKSSDGGTALIHTAFSVCLSVCLFVHSNV